MPRSTIPRILEGWGGVGAEQGERGLGVTAERRRMMFRAGLFVVTSVGLATLTGWRESGGDLEWGSDNDGVTTQSGGNRVFCKVTRTPTLMRYPRKTCVKHPPGGVSYELRSGNPPNARWGSVAAGNVKDYPRDRKKENQVFHPPFQTTSTRVFSFWSPSSRLGRSHAPRRLLFTRLIDVWG